MSLRNHMRIHGQKRYMCDLCGKAFRLARYLRNHQRIHDDGPNRFDCPSCCKSYRTMLELAQHRCTAAATNQVGVCKMVCGEEWTMPRIPAVPVTHLFFHELCGSSTGDGKQALPLTWKEDLILVTLSTLTGQEGSLVQRTTILFRLSECLRKVIYSTRMLVTTPLKWLHPPKCPA